MFHKYNEEKKWMDEDVVSLRYVTIILHFDDHETIQPTFEKKTKKK